MWNVVNKLVAKKEQRHELEDHQSNFKYLVPFDHEDDEEATLLGLDRPLWGSTSPKQRESTIA